MSDRKFMMATISMPVEIFEDGSHRIYTELYKIDFSESIEDSEILDSIMKISGGEIGTDSDSDSDSDSEKSMEEPEESTFIEKISQILASEIKPRRAPSLNTSFKVYPHRRSTSKNLRFSRKTREAIHITDEDCALSNSNKAVADSPEVKMETA